MNCSIVHLITVHAAAGKAAAAIVMSGMATALARHQIAWWVAPPEDHSGDIKVMARVPHEMPPLTLDQLLAAYSALDDAGQN